MKVKNLFIFLLMFSFLLFLSSCDEVKDDKKDKVYEVNFVDYDNSILKTQEVKHGLSASAPDDPQRIGYTFLGWNNDFNKVLNDLTVKPIYSANFYEIKFSENGGSDVIDLLLEYGNELPQLPTPNLKGHNLVGWFIDEQLTNRFVDNYVPSEDISLYAKWEPISYRIDFDTVEGETLDSIFINYGDAVDNLPTPIKDGFRFIGWEFNNEIVDNTFNYDFDSNIKLTAKWGLADLGGYTIRIVEPGLLGYTNTINPFSSNYTSYDKEARQKAWSWVEEAFNCKIKVEYYPEDDATYGLPRWLYIEEQAKNPKADFYLVPDGIIPRFVNSKSIVDITNLYNEYGQNYMNFAYQESGSCDGKLYSITDQEAQIFNVMYYNVNLLEKLGMEKTPAQLFLDGEWTYSKFRDYAIEAQKALNSLSSTDPYYAVAGCAPYYWVGMTNSAGVKLIDTTKLQLNILDSMSLQAANTLQEIRAANAMSPDKEVDAGIKSWMGGRALFASGDLWFKGTSNRWPADLWGDDTKYGFVPFPRPDGTLLSQQKIGVPGTETLVMINGKNYDGYSDECRAENIYQAIAQTFIKTKEFLKESDIENKYNYLSKYTDSADSLEAFKYISSKINEIGFFDPIANPDNVIVHTAYGPFSTAVNDYIMGKLPDFKQAVEPHLPLLTESLWKYFK